MIRVLICDDQDVVREGLRAILKNASEIEVVGMASDGMEAVEMVAKTQPQVVLMDLKMPGMNGIHATQQICKLYPDVHVLVLTTYDADEWVFDAIRSGAEGYLLKDTPREQLIEAIKGTAEGMTYVDPHVAGKIFKRVSRQSDAPDTTIIKDLSPREQDILRLLAQGLNNAEIAGRLYLSEGTVRNYVTSILAKLNVTDRTQAAVMAVRHGFMEDNGS